MKESFKRPEFSSEPEPTQSTQEEIPTLEEKLSKLSPEDQDAFRSGNWCSEDDMPLGQGVCNKCIRQKKQEGRLTPVIRRKQGNVIPAAIERHEDPKETVGVIRARAKSDIAALRARLAEESKAQKERESAFGKKWRTMTYEERTKAVSGDKTEDE